MPADTEYLWWAKRKKKKTVLGCVSRKNRKNMFFVTLSEKTLQIFSVPYPQPRHKRISNPEGAVMLRDRIAPSPPAHPSRWIEEHAALLHAAPPWCVTPHRTNRHSFGVALPPPLSNIVVRHNREGASCRSDWFSCWSRCMQ